MKSVSLLSNNLQSAISIIYIQNVIYEIEFHSFRRFRKSQKIDLGCIKSIN